MSRRARDKNDLAFGGGENRLEIAPVRRTDRKRIEFGGGNDVIREQAILGDAARPARGIETEQPNERPRRSRQRARRHPGDARRRLRARHPASMSPMSRSSDAAGPASSALRQIAKARRQ